MKSLLVTGYDDAMKEVGSLTSPLMRSYADAKRMDFFCARNYHPGCHPSWQKALMIRQFLDSGYDLVLWLDADTVITNPNIDTIIQDRPITASLDWGNDAYDESCFSLGNFIAKRCNGWKFLWDQVLSSASEWSNKPLWEQASMQYFYRGSSTRHSMFSILPRRSLNSVHAYLAPSAPEPWQPGDFLCHLTGEEITMEKRLATFYKLKEELGL